MTTARAWKRLGYGSGLISVLLGLCPLADSGRVRGEERKFAVMLAHSPKTFVAGTQPGNPPGGLEDRAAIEREYFSRSSTDAIGSFAEYWDEISYGSVFVTGRAFGWVTVPWAFEPTPPNAPARPSPENFINLYREITVSLGPNAAFFVPSPYAYGAGEDFCDCFFVDESGQCLGSSDINTALDPAACGALIIIDTVGNRRNAPPPRRGPGMDDSLAVGLNVWTPGERFVDVDADLRWDGIDEVNDRMCLGRNGCREPHCNRSDLPCLTSGDCPSGETCVTDPLGSGPRGCQQPGCGDLQMPWIDWDSNGEAENCAACVIPQMPPCRSGADCEPPPGGMIGVCQNRQCVPANCVQPTGGCGTQLPECCDAEGNPEGCVEGDPGLDCGSPPIECCEFDDGADDDNQLTVPEPFEDFMVRWEPRNGSAASVWVPVDEAYVRNNYPGDVEALVRRTGNGIYDPPDVFFDFRVGNQAVSTKMMQDAGPNQFAYTVPEPGTCAAPFGPCFAAPPIEEKPWFQQFWKDYYGTEAPAWPLFSPRMRPFNPQEPLPPVARNQAGRRWIRPNRGGRDGNGVGTRDDPFQEFDSDNPDGQILPEERFGYYDGWVEHDDLPSSKYHHQGDKRLGEITSPSTDTVSLPNSAEPYTAIFGVDLGQHNPNVPQAILDHIVPAAGPYAVKIHGEKGYDAGDVSILETLTWRANIEDEDDSGTIEEAEQHRTIGYQWSVDNGFYHPFASPLYKTIGQPPNTKTVPVLGPNGPIGFKDYNLDGMIDQGEARPERSENYSADSNPVTTNDGTASEYPFNRRRLVEDVVEALDPNTDWDDFIDLNSLEANRCSYGAGVEITVGFDAKSFNYANPEDPNNADDLKFISAEGFVSGIVLTPANSYDNINRFPTAPSYYPIHNEDNDGSAFMIPDYPADPFDPAEIHQSFNLFFHDLVVCTNCRTPRPAVTPYAAHEYLHTWHGFPDLYDYDVFPNPPVNDINCPIGAWDIMAGTGRGGGSLVHPVPILKEGPCTEWIDPIDLTTVLTPGVQATLTLPPVEFVRNGYYFLENEKRLGERYYFWSAGRGFDSRMPGPGMLILHTDVGANPDALPIQQTSPPFSYAIVQADGRNDLETCSSTGNDGDPGDPWPGTSDTRQFNFNTNPSATWYSLNTWTGIDISDVEQDQSGSTLLTITWVPTTIPSLRFVQPPGGESVPDTNIYTAQFDVSDVFGGTTVRLYYMPDRRSCSGSGSPCDTETDCPAGQFCDYDVRGAIAPANFIESIPKSTPGTVRLTTGPTQWNIGAIDDGRYVLFAKLNPGPGRDGTEDKFTIPRAGRNNTGNGALGEIDVSIDNDGDDTDDKARLETWTAVLIDAAQGTWRVNSTLTQPVLDEADPDADPWPKATTGNTYTSVGGEVSFRITAGTAPFAIGDTFSFTTTGITAASRAVTVINGIITEDPLPVIDASPLSGDPPLTVDFDASQSRDPNDEPLAFSWNFGDPGSGDQNTATGALVTHEFRSPGTFTVVLRATNARTGRFSESQVDIQVNNNSPTARVSAGRTSGPAPLLVNFDGSQSSDSESPADSLIYQWSFGDGTTANDQRLPGPAFRIIDHTYRNRADGTPCTPSNPCSFTATLTVTDEHGGFDTDSLIVRVGNSDPVPVVTAAPTTGVTPLAVTFNAKTSTDPEGQALTVVWNWGDGSPTETYPAATGKPPATDGSVPHTFTLRSNETTSTYHPTAVVRDGFGGEATWPGVNIVVTAPGVQENQPPVASFTVSPTTGFAGVTSFTFNASASNDPDGGSLTYSWNFGDGQQASGVVVNHIYQNPNLSGYVVRLTVRDPRNASTDTTRTVVVNNPAGNQPPVAHIATGPRTGTAPASLLFDGRASFDPDGDQLLFRWEFRENDVLIDTLIGPLITRAFSEPGTFTVELQVADGRGGVGRDGPETVTISEGGPPPEPPPPPPDDGDDEPPDSADQRPPSSGICGVGMITAVFASFGGLSAIKLVRRRRP